MSKLSEPVKRILITKHAPKETGCGSLSGLIGREFDVIEEDRECNQPGVYIKWGDTGLYFIFEGEYEEINNIEGVN